MDPRFAEYRATGDRRIRNELVEDHRWLALHCARQFARKGEPLDDLVQVATVGVLKAVDRFDPSYGVVFTTFAVPTITGELRRHFRDKTWSVHVPRRAKELYQSVSGVAEELSQTLMRSPTVPEIAQRSGTTVEEALEAAGGPGLVPGRAPGPARRRRAAGGPGVGDLDAGFAAAEARLTVSRLLQTLGRAGPPHRGAALPRRPHPVRDRRPGRGQPGAGVAAAADRPRPPAPALLRDRA